MALLPFAAPPFRLPSQTGNAGEILKTNGTSVAWGNYTPAQIVRVNPNGTADYTTVSAALTAITDATTTKRYIIQVEGEVVESAGFAWKQFICGLVGVGKNSKIRWTNGTGNCITSWDDGTEAYFFDNLNLITNTTGYLMSTSRYSTNMHFSGCKIYAPNGSGMSFNYSGVSGSDTKDGAIGLYLDECSLVTKETGIYDQIGSIYIRNSNFSSTSGVALSLGTQLSGKITSTLFYSSASYPINIAADTIDFANCLFESVSTYAMYASTFNNFSMCTFKSIGSAALATATGGGGYFSNCLFDRVRQNGTATFINVVSGQLGAPNASYPFKVTTLKYYNNIANAGATFSIGSTPGGNDIVNGASLANVGTYQAIIANTPILTAGSYIYFSVSGGTQANVYVFPTANFEYVPASVATILGTGSGESRFKNCTIVGSANGYGIDLGSGDSGSNGKLRFQNCFIETSLSTSGTTITPYAVRANSSTADVLEHCTVKGVLSNVTSTGYLADETNKKYGFGTATPSEKIHAVGNIFIDTDSNKLLLGAGKDAGVYYDGTNMIIDPKLVGSGILSILGGTDADLDARSRQGIFDGDNAGVAATNSVTGVTDTPTTDPGWASSDTVPMTAPNGYIKAYVGTQAVVIPYWNT